MLVTYGPSARIALDGDVVHEGRQSLRVSADQPSDVALGQDIALEPAGVYRFSGWVQTQGLERLDFKGEPGLPDRYQERVVLFDPDYNQGNPRDRNRFIFGPWSVATNIVVIAIP